MKNLTTFVWHGIDFGCQLIAYCINYDDEIVYGLTKDLEIIKHQKHSRHSLEKLTELNDKLKACVKNPIGQLDVVLFEFVVEARGILLVTKCGRFILLSLDSPHQVDCIYEHGHQLSSVSLSPSQDLIALADRDNQIQIVSCLGYGVVCSADALKNNDSVYKPVGVGWGSKETQFFGLDGRPSYETTKAPQEVMTDDEKLIAARIQDSMGYLDLKEQLDRPTAIDWRCDGQLIATLTFVKDSGKHYLKVWNRNLELQYVSEQLVSFEGGLLTWVPDGRSVCLAQRRDQTINEVVFFEKNGLVRQRLTLPSKMRHIYIKSMSWSPSSYVLAVIVRKFSLDKNSDIMFQDILMLYTMQNWHYYLKFSEPLQPANCSHTLKWDTANSSRLHVMSLAGFLRTYDCCPTVDLSLDKSTVLVVDGDSLLITPLEICVVPPPMAAIKLTTKYPICKVATLPDNASRTFILTLDNKLICTGMSPISEQQDGLLSIDLVTESASKLCQELYKYCVYDLGNEPPFQNLLALDETHLIAGQLSADGSDLVLYSLEQNTFQREVIKSWHHKRVISFSNIVPYESKDASIILDDGSAYIFALTSRTLKECPWLQHQMSVLGSNSGIITAKAIRPLKTSDSSQVNIVSLSRDFSLRFNDKVIASNCCSSFIISENFLVYTTTDNNMHFIPLDRLRDQALNEDAESLTQSIESGGTLVAVMESKSQVILQMPRGNLEIIHPRVLLFSTITKLLDKSEYVKPCRLARRHRINTNFLIDYIFNSGSASIEPLKRFAKTVAEQDPSLMSLIISELDNSNTLMDRYSSIINYLPSSMKDTKIYGYEYLSTSKVNLICKNFSLLLDESNNLHLKLQTLLKMEPKLTGEALKLIKDLDHHRKGSALKFMLYFVDIDQLFNEALGTYDMDIALMVAQASNKDPKEYLILLRELNEIEDVNLRCYEIDIRIKRYNFALGNLFRHFVSRELTDEESDKLIDRIVEFVKTKRLYKCAVLDIPKHGLDAHRKLNEKLWYKYTEYLLEKRHHLEAALAGCAACHYGPFKVNFDITFKCFLLANDWQKNLLMIDRFEFSNFQQRKDVCDRLKEQLTLSGNFTEAILLSKLFDDPNADQDGSLVEDLLSTQNWCLAEIMTPRAEKPNMRLRIKDKLVDVTSTGGVVKLVESMSRELSLARDQFRRLCELLRTPKTRSMDHNDSLTMDGASTTDNSDISSILSGDNSTKQTKSGASSMKTRKQTRISKSITRRITTKPGSRYEDLALIRELQMFIKKQKEYYSKATDMVGYLILYRSYIDALELNEQIRTLLRKCLVFCQEVCDELWPKSNLMDQKFSLYLRYGAKLAEAKDNLDFEILIRPDIPTEIDCLEF